MTSRVQRRPRPALARLGLLALTLAVVGAGLAGAQGGAPAQASLVHLPLLSSGRAITQPEAISFWGMNAYLSKRERISAGDNLTELARLAREAGVAWTREELPWDLIEPNDDDFRGVYDADLRLAAEQGFGIIGMLLTTPAWARDGACSGNYWCPPANVNEYAEFAAWMVERYDGDGRDDAPGSPRVAYWQLWNEPNDTALWPNIGGGADARKLRYGQLLVAAYQAIKAADPTATVLSGGVYIYDGSCAGGLCDGLNFFNAAGGVFRQLPAARQAFDIFAIHPYIPDRRPDDPAIPRIITVEGRIRNTRAWLDDPAVGRPDAPLWISEIGWCSAPGACPGGAQISEAQQANYLARSLVIAQQNGVQHASWFQLEDAFDDPGRLWGNAAILRQYNGATYPLKPAYSAYRTLATQLAGASPVGTGPLHTHSYDPANPFVGSGGTYNYRYTRGTTVIDLLWRPDDTLQASLPVAAGATVTRVTIDGATTVLAPSGGAVSLTLSEQPVIVVQSR
jgi:hypothetical protein